MKVSVKVIVKMSYGEKESGRVMMSEGESDDE